MLLIHLLFFIFFKKKFWHYPCLLGNKLILSRVIQGFFYFFTSYHTIFLIFSKQIFDTNFYSRKYRSFFDLQKHDSIQMHFSSTLLVVEMYVSIFCVVSQI